MAVQREASSFRDDRGFIFWHEDQVYRLIRTSGQTAYDQLMSGGLYERLQKRELMVAHTEVPADKVPHGAEAGYYKVIRPELVPFILYPYEWSFSQLKDAALVTLELQQEAMEHGMTLRDASAYNIQFVNGKPQLIDTLSFDTYKPGEAWIAYRQFCQHFLAPLALMSRVDLGLSQLLRVHLDGIPLPLATKMLPLGAKLRPGLATHIGLHARMQRQHEDTARKVERSVSTTSLKALVDSLQRTVRSLRLPEEKTQWGDYYDNTNYSDASFQYKKELVGAIVERVKPARVLDLGSNDGSFSRVAAEAGAWVLSADVDPIAVELNYRKVRQAKEQNLLPMLFDVTNPSPALGWANRERMAFSDRAKVDMVLALAIIHHLAIANNVPLELVAGYCAGLAPELVLEFVPKEDSQVKRLLATREDIFPDYTTEGIEKAFGRKFEIVKRYPVKGSERTLYHLRLRRA